MSRFLKYFTYRGADKSLARPDWKNNWKVAIFVQRGGHCCCGDPVGQTTFWIFFEWLAKVRVWSLWLVTFLVGLRTYQHPGTPYMDEDVTAASIRQRKGTQNENQNAVFNYTLIKLQTHHVTFVCSERSMMRTTSVLIIRTYESPLSSSSICLFTKRVISCSIRSRNTSLETRQDRMPLS